MINTEKKGNIAQHLLNCLTHGSYGYSLRSVGDLAAYIYARGSISASHAEIVEVAQSLGLVQKKRKSDGATLFGLKEKVDAAAAARAEADRVARERREAEERAAREAAERQRRDAERLDPNYEKKSRLREAMEDVRWTWRTFGALAAVAGVTVEEARALIGQMDGVETSANMAALTSRT